MIGLAYLGLSKVLLTTVRMAKEHLSSGVRRGEVDWPLLIPVIFSRWLWCVF